MFYKRIENELYSGTTVESKTYLLNETELDINSLPIDGWYWFETESKARRFFNLSQDEDQNKMAKELSPREVPNAFKEALGVQRGIYIWAKIYKSNNPIAVFWVSQYNTGEKINLDNTDFISALRLLCSTILDDGDVTPVLNESDVNAVIDTLHTIYNRELVYRYGTT